MESQNEIGSLWRSTSRYVNTGDLMARIFGMMTTSRLDTIFSASQISLGYPSSHGVPSEATY